MSQKGLQDVVFLTPENSPKKSAGAAGGNPPPTSFQPTTFSAQLLDECPAFAPARLPRTFILRVSVESLDFVSDDADSVLLAQVPFQTIQSWGSNVQAFKITVFDHARVSGGSEVVLVLKTLKGRAIEDCTVAAVQRLMNAMETHCLKKAEFDELRSEITDPATNGLVEQWREKVGQLVVKTRGRTAAVFTIRFLLPVPTRSSTGLATSWCRRDRPWTCAC